jgi:hypothetical protein
VKYLSIVLSWLLISICVPSNAQETTDAPAEVLRLLDRATGSWSVKIGQVGSACTVNSRAGGRCVIVEGRNFADGFSYTSVLGWYASKRQMVGLIFFENGESLLVRADVKGGAEDLTAEGDVVGVLSGRTVKATYKAAVGTNTCSVELQTADGKTIKGQFRNTNGNR